MNAIDTRFRIHDPAAGADSAIPEHVLHQILAEPRPIAGAAPKRSVAHRRLALAVGLAGVSVVGVVAGAGLPGGAPGLAERAYAATAPVDVVVHSVRTGTLVLSGNPNIPEALRTTTSRTETWQHGDELFATIDQPGSGTTRQALSDGILKIRTPSGELQTTTQAELDHGRPSAPWSVDPVLDFRQAYDEDRLTETGTVTFAGRSARRFVVPDVRSVGKDATDVDAREFFVDPGTAEPLGSRQTYTVLDTETGARTQDVSTVVIDRLERRAPTPRALDDVTRQP